MDRFDTKVQYLKYSVLKEVARHAWDDTLWESIVDIPKDIVPGRTPTMRCCVYKERAILSERVKLATGGDKRNPNVIEVIDIACDDCPAGGYEITNACRGCLAHRCMDVCKKGAITLDHNQKAHIDKSKCVECGMCAKVCPYSAIINSKRPCQNSCKVKAISMSEEKAATLEAWQWPAERKEAASDLVVDNAGTPADLRARIPALLEQLTALRQQAQDDILRQVTACWQVKTGRALPGWACSLPAWRGLVCWPGSNTRASWPRPSTTWASSFPSPR